MAKLFRRRNKDPRLIERAAHGTRSLAVQDLDWRKPSAIPDADVADLVLYKYRIGKQRRQNWEGQAAEQLAWARGNQHLVWNEQARDLIAIAFEHLPLEFRDPVYINKIKPLVLTFIGMVVGQPLTWSVTPATREDDDVAGAKVLGKLMSHYWTAGRQQQRKLINMLWMTCCTGLGFIKILWDPRQGVADRFTPEVLLNDLDAEALAPESRRQRKKLANRFKKYVSEYGFEPDDEGGVDVPQGEPAIDFPTGFDITEPEMAKDVATSSWMIESRFYSVEMIRDQYGVDVPATAEQEHRRYRSYEQFGGMDSYSGNTPSLGVGEDALVHEFWRPKIEGTCPRGFHALVTHDGRVLKKGPHPYIHGKLPYVRVTEMPEPDFFRPGCMVRDVMGLQRARNKQRSQLHGHLASTLDPKFLTPADSGLTEDFFKRGTKVGQLKNGVSRDQVGPLQRDQPPNYMGVLDDMNRRDMEEVAGIHRSTLGQADGKQQSGKHADILRRQDAQRIGVMRQIVEEAFAEAGQQLGWLLWEFVTTERAVNVMGSEGRSQVVRFKGSELARNKPFGPHAFNVRVKLSVEADMDVVHNRVEILTRFGYLNPEKEDDRLLVMRWLGEQVPDEMDVQSEHRHNAAEENDRMVLGELVRAAYGDEDAVHIAEHLHFTTTARYRQAMRRNPNIDLIMRLHIRDHHYNQADKEFRPVAIAKRTQAELVQEYKLMPARQPAMPGAAGPGGPPGGPATPQRSLPGGGAPGGAPGPTPPRERTAVPAG